MSVKVAIFGAGNIGSAVYQMIDALSGEFNEYVNAFVIDSSVDSINRLVYGSHYVCDIESSTVEKITQLLTDNQVKYVINAMPFFLNEKIAHASKNARCHYIDFTEDDIMAQKVQSIYAFSGLTCAVKCGLAPGFINYIGMDLVSLLDNTESLKICVGALPRTADISTPGGSYNLSWSVDGLVNEYIRPCNVKVGGKISVVDPLTEYEQIILDGCLYEAATTSGGVGSLIHDLPNVPNVCYKTLRYPGHYEHVRGIVARHNGNFTEIKSEFEEIFPENNDDVIIVYATAVGKLNGKLTRKVYFSKFYSNCGLSGIQSTTAAAGVAMLELMLDGKVGSIVNHKDVRIDDFYSTCAYAAYYVSK